MIEHLFHFSRDSSILLDCSEGTCHQIENFYGTQANDVFAQIRGVFLSHLHSDHYLGEKCDFNVFYAITRGEVVFQFRTGLFRLLHIRRKLGLNKKRPLYLFATNEFEPFLEQLRTISESLISDYILVPNKTLVSYRTIALKSNSERLQFKFIYR